MKNRRLPQIVFSLGIVLSLFASSISAVCLCRETAENHCQPMPSHETNAENHSYHAKEETISNHHESPDKYHHEAVSTDIFSFNATLDECCCSLNTPKVFAKTETVKIEKQAINYQPNAPPQTVLTAPSQTAETVYYTKPLYLSDSFHNIKSPRAPPRL